MIWKMQIILENLQSSIGTLFTTFLLHLLGTTFLSESQAILAHQHNICMYVEHFALGSVPRAALHVYVCV